MYISLLNLVLFYSSMTDSSMSKLKLGPQESEENGKCNYSCLVWVGGHRSYG